MDADNPDTPAADEPVTDPGRQGFVQKLWGGSARVHDTLRQGVAWVSKGRRLGCASIVAAVILLGLALLSAAVPLVGGISVVFGVVLKGVSSLLTAVGKTETSTAKPDKELEEWTGWLDAFAVCFAFPGLFAAAAVVLNWPTLV